MGSLRKAIDALQESLDTVHGSGKLDGLTGLKKAARAGVVQNFKVAYEQCWKFLQRWIRENGNPDDADSPRTRKDLFRLSARYGLLADPTPWFEYGDARNLTSHTYDEATADRVFQAAERFATDARELAKRLESMND